MEDYKQPFAKSKEHVFSGRFCACAIERGAFVPKCLASTALTDEEHRAAAELESIVDAARGRREEPSRKL